MPPNAEDAAALAAERNVQTATPSSSSGGGGAADDDVMTIRPLPMPTPEEWKATVQASVALVPKLLNILRSRGLPFPNDDDNNDDDPVDFGPVENLLGCSLPADYKALIQGLPNIPTAWGLDPFYLFRPDEMYSEMQQLQAVCHSRAEYQGVSMKPSDPVSFVPFGNSTSAFYCGWIKTHDHYNDQAPWELVVLDSKNYFDYEPGEGMYRPLVEVLYRMVVRAVPDDVWALRGGGCGRASYFWHSEEESDEADLGITRYARDGSQDHAASHEERIVVLGRPVCFLGGSDPEEPRNQDTSGLERNSCFKGCSEEDFKGVGEYNLEHPIDVQVYKEQKRLREAPREDARVSLEGTDTIPTETLALVQDQTLRQKLHKAAMLKRKIAVGERWGALIGRNGKLAMVDTSNQYLWWNTRANSMLREDEVFTDIDAAGVHMVCLTNQGRILTIRGFPPTYSFKSFEKLRKTAPFPLDFCQVSAGEHAAAAITKEGRIVYWGSVATMKGGVTKVTVQEPFFVPNMSKIVDINLMGRGLCILHSSGRVSLITKKEGLRIIDASHKVVAVHATGDRVFMLNNIGQVLGLGGRAQGQLPLAVTEETLEEYETAKAQYKQDIVTFAEKVMAFRRSIVEHSASCKKCKDKPKIQADDFTLTLQDGVYTADSLARVTETHGMSHTPQSCSAPEMPESIQNSPRPPVHPIEKEGEQPMLKDPTVLTVGKAHQEALENVSTVDLPKDAWNAVTGPYGCKPGSFAPVTAVSGMSACSAFLHADGTLSSCGDGKPLCTGLVPPGSERTNAVYSGRKWGPIGIPLAVEPLCDDGKSPKFAAVVMGGAGMLAVQEDGQLWGCGDAVGTADCSELLEKLVVLQ